MLPSDPAAERAVLTAIVLRPSVFPDCGDLTCPDDFADPRHRAFAEALWSLGAAHEPIDEATLSAKLRSLNRLQLIGGDEGISELCRDAVSSHNVLRHARRVRDVAAARRLALVALDVHGGSESALDDPAAWVDRSASRLAEASRLQRDDGGVLVRDILESTFRDLEARAKGEHRGIGTRYGDLDAITQGFHPGEYVIVAARPSCGKSALVMNFAGHTAIRDQIPVRVFSLEMPRAKLMHRILAEHARVDHARLRSGKLTQMEADSLLSASAKIAKAPLELDDARGLTIGELCARARQWRRDPKRGGARKEAMVVVDYLQLLRPTSPSKVREQDVAEISRGLFNLAGQLECPVIVAAQLNRAIEQRAKSKPMLSDLRESGSIEQDADTILFVHRPDRVDESITPGTTELIVAKQRDGETGIVNLHFVGRLTSFEPVERRRMEVA